MEGDVNGDDLDSHRRPSLHRLGFCLAILKNFQVKFSFYNFFFFFADSTQRLSLAQHEGLGPSLGWWCPPLYKTDDRPRSPLRKLQRCPLERLLYAKLRWPLYLRCRAGCRCHRAMLTLGRLVCDRLRACSRVRIGKLFSDSNLICFGLVGVLRHGSGSWAAPQ